MASVKIACPACGYAKDVPAEKLPPGSVRVTCPKCKTPFTFDKTAPAPENEETPQEPQQKPQTQAPKGPTATITCPECGLTREVPEARVPAGRIRLTCPGCKRQFAYEKPGVQAPAPEPPPVTEETTGAPAPEPEAPPAVGEVPAGPEETGAAATPRPDINILRAKVNAGLAGTGELFAGAWDSLKKRPGTLYGLLLFSYIFPLAALALVMGACYLLASLISSGRLVVLAAGGAAGITAYFAAAGLAQGALFTAVCDEGLGFRDALGAGRLRMWSFVWVPLLYVFMVVGGLLFFVVPGIVFAIWFGFCFFVLAEEGDTGMAALLKSREYVQGHWFGVFGRLLVIWLVSLVGMVPVAGILLSFLLTPLVLLYMYGIYRSLKELRPIEGFAPPAREKAKWVGAGAMGFVFIPLIVAAFVLSFSMKHGVSIDQAIKELGIGRALSLISLPHRAPDGGGEMGDAYRKYRDALDRGDVDALKTMVAPDVAAQLDGPGASLMLGMIKAFAPGGVTVTGSEADGDRGTLQVQSEQGGNVFTGTVEMLRRNGAWLVAKENWDMTPMPKPVRLSGGRAAPDFNPIPAKYLSSPGFGVYGGAGPFFNKEDKPRLLKTLTGHEGGVRAVGFTPDGSRLVSASYDDYTVRLWDVYSGAVQDSVRLDNRPVSMALTPDGSTLIVADANQYLTFLPVGYDGFGEGQKASAELGSELRLAVSPNGSLLATSSFDKRVTVWDLDAKKELARMEMPEPMRAVAFSPSGGLLAAGSTTHKLTIWDLAGGEGRTYAVSKVGKDSDISSIAISPDDKYLVTGHMDSSIVIWDLENQEELFNFYVTDASTMAAAFSPDGGVFATANATAKGEIFLWEPATARRKMTLTGNDGLPTTLAFSPDGRYMASGGEDGKINVWGRSLEPSSAPYARMAIEGLQVSVNTDTGASLRLDKSSYNPGENIVVSFAAPEGYNPDAWIGIMPSSVPHGSESENDRHDISYQYLSGRTSGEMGFAAPSAPGEYDMRMHDTDADGREVATVTFRVGASAPAAAGPAPQQSGANSPDRVSYKPAGKPQYMAMYIYALNYTGMVRVNGKDFYEIKGERDMNYNSQTGVDLVKGQNTIDLEYKALPDSWKTEIRIKVLVYDESLNIEETPAEWVVEDAGGRRRFTLDLDW